MILIKNGKIKTMAGAEYEKGCLLLGDDGKIAAIGEDVKAPADAEVIDAEGRLVTPGCIDAHTHIGVYEEALRWEGQDGNERSDPVVPHMRAIDAIRPFDEAFELAVKGGVTTAITGPGSANVVGGTHMAIKLCGISADEMVIRDPVGMKCAFGENPKNAYGQNLKKSPTTRMGVAALLRELLTRSREYLSAKEAGKEPKYDAKLEAMIPVMKKQIPLKAHAHRAEDILTAIRIAKEFDLRLTLDHCTEGWRVAEILAKEGYPALVGPSSTAKTKVELAGKSLKTAGILQKAGVKISIVTDAPVIPLHQLPLCAALSVSEGLDVQEAWKAITINPAEICGIADRVGSLEVGKDADVVIWTCDPMVYVGAKAYVSIIDGKVVHR